MTIEPKQFIDLINNVPCDQQKEIIEAFYDSLPAFVIAIDLEGRITIFNKGAENLIGLPRQEILGEPLTRVVDYPLTESYIYQAMVEKRIINNIERNFLFYNRKVIFIGDVMPLYDQSGALVGGMGVFRDLQHLRDLEKRSRHMEALATIGQTAAGTVHEIRNPLTSIKGFTQLIAQKARKGDLESVQSYCKLITDEIEHVDHILTDFLTLSKPQEEKWVWVSIHNLISDVLSFMYGESLLAGLSVIYYPSDEDYEIECCQEKIKEVIINLCRNAFQAMKNGGTLTVSVERQGEWLIVSLKDTGCGIAPDQVREIFEPFYTTKPSGTGLGLAICQKIMADHGGKIDVASQLNEGSEFKVIFPMTGRKPETY